MEVIDSTTVKNQPIKDPKTEPFPQPVHAKPQEWFFKWEKPTVSQARTESALMQSLYITLRNNNQLHAASFTSTSLYEILL
jgi:hypothetical protein